MKQMTQKQAPEERLARAEALAAEREAILQQLADGVIITGPDGCVTFVNETARQIHGVAELGVCVEEYANAYNLLTLEGQPYPPEELPLARAARHGETTPVSEWLIRRPDGAEVVAQGSARPTLDADGRQIGAVLIVSDVTAQRTLERQKDELLEALNRAVMDAELATHVRDEFLGSASHDLNTPVATIRAFAQLLLRRVAKLDPELQPLMREGLQTINDTSSRITTLINQLVDLSKLQSGHSLELTVRPADLVALTRRLIESHRHTSERHYIRLGTELRELAGLWDESRLERVLDNLLSNAIKYSPGGGEVLVTIEREEGAGGRQAVLQVRDRGIGIPPVDLPRIFERFYRASNVEGRPGSGIGLAGVRDIVQQHGGSVAIESTEGVGTTVTVRLPLQQGKKQ